MALAVPVCEEMVEEHYGCYGEVLETALTSEVVHFYIYIWSLGQHGKFISQYTGSYFLSPSNSTSGEIELGGVEY